MHSADTKDTGPVGTAEIKRGHLYIAIVLFYRLIIVFIFSLFFCMIEKKIMFRVSGCCCHCCVAVLGMCPKAD